MKTLNLCILTGVLLVCGCAKKTISSRGIASTEPPPANGEPRILMSGLVTLRKGKKIRFAFDYIA